MKRMTSRLLALTFDANDPGRVASYWAGVLGWELTGAPVMTIVFGSDMASLTGSKGKRGNFTPHVLRGTILRD